jgi:hypothetical protein
MKACLIFNNAHAMDFILHCKPCMHAYREMRASTKTHFISRFPLIAPSHAEKPRRNLDVK